MSKIVYSNRFLQHETGSHLECKERLVESVKLLKKQGLFKPEQPLVIKEKDLLAVHEQSLIDEIKRRSMENDSTADNVFSSNTFEAALLACGSALKAALLSRKEFAFSLARPPGHHAGKGFFGGFCYFNNIAFAVRTMQEKEGIGKVLIVDFDLHHGNGTQDIFYDDESVFYLSLHQSPEFTFPGTGFAAENNKHVKNIALDEGTGDERYLLLLSENFSKAVDSFRPEVIAVSAGFDIFHTDGGVGNRLNIKNSGTFFALGKAVKEKGVRCFAVLEGGYNLQDLPVNLFNFLKAFG